VRLHGHHLFLHGRHRVRLLVLPGMRLAQTCCQIRNWKKAVL
jgi:hypothetical protein